MKSIIFETGRISKHFFSITRYTWGLLMTSGKKNCSEIARSTDRSHDSVQRDLNTNSQHNGVTRFILKNHVACEGNEEDQFIIINHSSLHKPHSKKIEAVHPQFSGSEIVKGYGAPHVYERNDGKI